MAALENGMLVEVETNTGVQQGTVRFIGRTQFAPDEWIGVELFTQSGKNDGSVGGIRYFSCCAGFGVFVKALRVRPLVMNAKIRTLTNEVTTVQNILNESTGPQTPHGRSIGLMFTSTLGVHKTKAGRIKHPSVAPVKTDAVPSSTKGTVVAAQVVTVPASVKQAVAARSRLHEFSVPSSGVRGLKNLGNTCFFNSVLQNLVHLPSFLDLLNHAEAGGSLTGALKQLAAEMMSSTDRSHVVDPKALFSQIVRMVPRFGSKKQQDAVEVLRYIMDGLRTESMRLASQGIQSTAVEQVFGGKLRSSITCRTCGYESSVHEPFFDLSVPLPKSFHSKPILARSPVKSGASAASTLAQNEATSVPTLESCLSFFTQPELLEGSNAYGCTRCTKRQMKGRPEPPEGPYLEDDTRSELQDDVKLVKRAAQKQFLIESTPKVLIIHLKRFTHTMRGQLQKLNGRLLFPETLDLFPFCHETVKAGHSYLKYSLRGIVVHSGTMSGGHYSAYVKCDALTDGAADSTMDASMSDWFYMTDTRIRRTTLQEVLQREAYILIYESQD